MDWGWTSYEKTGWKRDDGCKQYLGRFRAMEDPDSHFTCLVWFWAHRPILALREIVESGEDPLMFTEKTIN